MSKNRKYTQSDYDEVHALFAAGATPYRVSLVTGHPGDTMRRWWRKWAKTAPADQVAASTPRRWQPKQEVPRRARRAPIDRFIYRRAA